MELYPISKEDVEEIYRMHDTNREGVEDDVKVLEEWLKKQPHLPQKFQYPEFLEHILADCKFRIEQAKHKVEVHFTTKNFNKDFYELFGSNKHFILPTKNLITYCPMQKLGPQKERIFIGLVKNMDHDEFHMSHFVQAMLSMAELTLKYDRSNRIRVVVDCNNFTFDVLKRFDLAVLHRLAIFFFQAYVSRLIAIDLWNANAAARFMVSILRKVILDKIFAKIRFHANLEELHQSIGPEYLPEEIGGTQGSIKKVEAKVDGVIQDHRKFFMDIPNYVTNEKLRIGPCPYSHGVDMFGLDGTFKKLNID